MTIKISHLIILCRIENINANLAIINIFMYICERLNEKYDEEINEDSCLHRSLNLDDC